MNNLLKLLYCCTLFASFPMQIIYHIISYQVISSRDYLVISSTEYWLNALLCVFVSIASAGFNAARHTLRYCCACYCVCVCCCEASDCTTRSGLWQRHTDDHRTRSVCLSVCRSVVSRVQCFLTGHSVLCSSRLADDFCVLQKYVLNYHKVSKF